MGRLSGVQPLQPGHLPAHGDHDTEGTTPQVVQRLRSGRSCSSALVKDLKVESKFQNNTFFLNRI